MTTPSTGDVDRPPPPASEVPPSPAEPGADSPSPIRWTRFDWIVTAFGIVTMVVTIVASIARGDADVPSVIGRAVGFFLTWWIAFFGWGLLGQLVSRAAVRQDDEAIRVVRPEEPIQAPRENDRTLEASVEAITAQIERMESSIDRMERSAALVPAALGILATVALARLNTDVTGFPAYVGILAGGAALRAMTDAISCLSRYRFAGVSGYGELWRVDRDYHAFMVGRINLLISMLRYVHFAAAEKRHSLRMALFETAIAASALYAFAALGGFA